MNGSSSDFEVLVNQHKDVVYRQMLRACDGRHEDAEDVLVDALLQAWRHLGQLQDPAAFRSWLAQIGRRVCWRLRNREALLPLLQLSVLQSEGLDPAGPPPALEEQMDVLRMKALLDEALSALPAELAEIYRLRDLEGISGSEAASALGLSTAAMKSRLHRARTVLRTRLDSLLAAQAQNSLSRNLPEEKRINHD